MSTSTPSTTANSRDDEQQTPIMIQLSETVTLQVTPQTLQRMRRFHELPPHLIERARNSRAQKLWRKRS